MDSAVEKVWTIHRGVEFVGTARLTWHDAGMNVQGGAFEPGTGYAAVSSVFQLFADADGDDGKLHQYYKRRDALGLTITDEKEGLVQGIVHVLDFRKCLPGAPLEVEIYPPTRPSNKPMQADGPSGAADRP